MDIDVNQVRELMQALRDYGLHEVEVQRGMDRILVRAGGAAVSPAGGYLAAPQAPSEAPAPAATPIAAPTEVPPKPVAEGTYITSPFVGTFYRSPSPSDPSFVEVGQSVKAGQVLCIIEAMKLMNEIETEISGTIAEILVENGKPVEFGDQLFRVV